MDPKKAKKLIEKHRNFKSFYNLTGEDYNSALMMWLETHYDLVDVWDEDDAIELSKQIEQLNK